jgi:hypothetical protein
VVTPGYLKLLGVPLLRGRHLTDDDRATSERVIVVNEAAARKYWPGQEALGQHLIVNGQEHRVDYLPAESNTGMFGGNSNWRGPVWMPVNALIVRALINLYGFYGDDFKVQCPTGSGRYLTLFEVAEELGKRLTRIFLPDENGRRPVYGGAEKFQSDPHWKDYILFYEYFHGDNGAGLGAAIRPAGLE